MKKNNRPSKTGLYLLIIPLLIGNASAAWEPLESLPEPNGFFGCGVVGGKIVIAGGTNWKGGSKHWLDVIWSFDLRTGKWSSQGKLPHALAYPIAASWKDQLIIAGGIDGKQPQTEVWAVNRSVKFKQLGELKEPAILAASGIIGNDLFILGGCTDPGNIKGIRIDGFRLNLIEGKLGPMKPPGEVAFCLAASVVLGHEFFVFSGTRPDPVHEFANLDAAWVFDESKACWHPLRPYPFAARGVSAVQLDHHKILLAGGSDDSDKSTAVAYVYDTVLNSYSETLSLPVAGLVGLVRAGGYVYCLGGEDKGGHRMDECFRIKAAELLRGTNGKR